MKAICFSLAVITMMACHSRKDEVLKVAKFAVADETFNDMAAPTPQKMMMSSSVDTDRKLIREARLQMDVTSLKNISDSVNVLLRQYHAYASNEAQDNQRYDLRKSMTIRVGEQQFEPMMKRLEALATRIVERSVTTQDVTLEYTDLQARLRSKKELEVRYHEILRQAKTVKDMLAIEEQLGATREEIESMEARFKRMTNLTTYCTLDVVFVQRLEAPPTGFAQEFGVALTNGWRSIMNAVLACVSVWPWAFVGFALIGFVIRFRKRRMAQVG
ncbi:DUF4349 domain-containing protein [Chryseolinea soli]|uniref:DUF4349 domain-containing protein n=1 Tax=Chryseolinea soli TaxID=2321403 RepID=A0A385SR46_9BACT|nr:DUF4349 domain-containing protein [Chryseolinea soli]AYB32425.1 DUF4349 domain-containing protein [Chryseolinea soli]